MQSLSKAYMEEIESLQEELKWLHIVNKRLTRKVKRLEKKHYSSETYLEFVDNLVLVQPLGVWVCRYKKNTLVCVPRKNLFVGEVGENNKCQCYIDMKYLQLVLHDLNEDKSFYITHPLVECIGPLKSLESQHIKDYSTLKKCIYSEITNYQYFLSHKILSKD